MNLANALAVLADPIRGLATNEALWTVGKHLAAKITPVPRAVAVAVGTPGVELQRGLGETLVRAGHQAMPLHITQPHTKGCPSRTTFSWITSEPPPGVPLVVTIPHLVTGATVRALLAQHHPDGDEIPVVVAAIDTEPSALAELLAAHPGIQVVTATDMPNPGS